MTSDIGADGSGKKLNDRGIERMDLYRIVYKYLQSTNRHFGTGL